MPDPEFLPTILVTGANGQLAGEIRMLSAEAPSYHFLFTTREELPIENEEIVERFFERHRIDYCINCAAYTAVDKAETESDKAFLINGDAVGTLARICAFHKAKLIHISTDYVYDGSRNEPLQEDDPTGPVNIYGESKLKGEQLALKNNAGSLIIRTSWVYSSLGNNFVKTMLRLFREKKEIHVVSDQYGSPTYAADLARLCMLFIEEMSRGNDFSGIVNYSNAGVTTWYGFAEEIRKQSGSSCIIHPVPSSAYKTAAQRPAFSVLDTRKVEQMLSLTIPSWQESLKKCMARLSG